MPLAADARAARPRPHPGRRAAGTWGVGVCLCLLALMLPGPAAAHAAIASGDQARLPVWLSQGLLIALWWAYPLGAVRVTPRARDRAAFHAGMLVAGLALLGPFDDWAGRSTAMHMAQHMMLIVVAAPLLVLGRPLPQWRAALGAWVAAAARPVLRSTRYPMAWAGLHGLAIWFWHLPGPYMAAVFDNWLHVLEHACFLLTAWPFWWSVLRAPAGRRGTALLALLITLMHTGLLGAVLAFSTAPLYFAESRSLADQQLAGLLMWAPGGLAYMAGAARCAHRWLGADRAGGGFRAEAAESPGAAAESHGGTPTAPPAHSSPQAQ